MTSEPALPFRWRRSARHSLRRGLAIVVLVAAAFVVGWPTMASAHSLDSTTISLRVHENSADATVTVAVETLDAALGTDFADQDLATFSAEAIDYLNAHFNIVGQDGLMWGETWTNPERETVEGIDSFRADVSFDTTSSSTTSFTVDYDAVIEADPNHQAVVVLTDSDGDISTAGIATGGDTAISVVDRDGSVPVIAMVRFGFDHVLEGADHLLFLMALLLPAPMIAIGGRWQRGEGLVPTAKRVLHVITAFTIGHSITLMASALGVVSIPTRPVEVIIAASVAVSAIHAIKPLARRGEELIAGTFGLVHGLAFAGILTSLGLEGRTSVASLLAFNIGIELSQLLVTALVFPSMYALSRTRSGRAVRITMAAAALVAALAWATERLDLLPNPFGGIETAIIEHPWWLVTGLAALAMVATALDQLGSDDVILTPVACAGVLSGVGADTNYGTSHDRGVRTWQSGNPRRVASADR